MRPTSSRLVLLLFTGILFTHQGAIEMAKVELQFGTDPNLRRLAQEIIVTQQSEIDVMKLALKNSPVLSQKQNKKSWCSR